MFGGNPQTLGAVSTFSSLSRSQSGLAQRPASSLKDLLELAEARQRKTIIKMGRLRFELRTNRLKANWTSLKSPAVQGLGKQPPNTPPNKSVRLVRPSWQTSGQICPPFEQMGKIKQPLLDLRLPLSATVHRAAERQAGENAQSLIHSLINPSLWAYTEEGHWMLL